MQTHKQAQTPTGISSGVFMMHHIKGSSYPMVELFMLKIPVLYCFQISCSQGILNSSRLLLLSSPKIACLHVSFTAYENFYKLSKIHCHLVLTFPFLILRMSEYRNSTIKHISTYTLVSSSITTYVTDLFLGSISHSEIPF